MKKLKDKIREVSTIIDERIVKVDSFLNHQVDAKLMAEAGKEFAEVFQDKGVTKVLTVESSGIAPAYATALELGVDLVFARKSASLILQNNKDALLMTEIFSYTKNISTNVYIDKRFISKDDKILIIDDFLANGEVAKGLIEMIKPTGATIVGFGIVIEKSFQKGRGIIEEKGYPVHSLARIKSLKNNVVEFLE